MKQHWTLELYLGKVKERPQDVILLLDALRFTSMLKT